MSSYGFIYLDINPEPWAVGPLYVGKRGGKMFPQMGRNQSVHAFKEAVRGEIEGKVAMMPPGEYDIHFCLWRRLESYVGETGRKANAHVADATNMQKALEDALQGVLFDNDRDVRRITTEIMQQGVDVVPGIAIQYNEYRPSSMSPLLHEARHAGLARHRQPHADENEWPPPWLK